MRYAISLTLVRLLFCSGVATADEKSQVFPQDPKKQEQRFRDMLVWNRRTLGEAYDKVGGPARLRPHTRGLVGCPSGF